jgi:phospholipase A1
MSRRGRYAFIFLGLAPLHAVAAPEDPTQSVAECRTLQTDRERLACYDHLFGAPASQSAPLLSKDATSPAAQPAHVSMIDQRWELQPDEKRGPFRLTAYKPVYVLAAFHASSTNTLPHSPNDENDQDSPLNLKNTEAKFQFSLKTKLWQDVIGDWSDLWFGYTQSSRWQVFNASESRPFRETDYEPELMMAFRTNYSLLGWDGRLTTFGINHQSNGRTRPLSRSWNRLMASAALERGPWVITLRPWWRINEDASSDDNPDIEDFMGRGEITLTHTGPSHELSATLRHSLRTGSRSHGSLETTWAFPIHGNLKGYLVWFSGYGESLIDYNKTANYFGAGVSLMQWYSAPP